MVRADRRSVDGNARVIHQLMHHPEGIALRHPGVAVDGFGYRPVVGAVNLIDGNDLARARIAGEFAILEAPPGGGVASESLVPVVGISAEPRLDVHDLQFEQVARSRAANRNRASADVNAEALAGSAPADRCVHRTGTAPVHRLAVRRPVKDAFGTGIAADHAVGNRRRHAATRSRWSRGRRCRFRSAGQARG